MRRNQVRLWVATLWVFYFGSSYYIAWRLWCHLHSFGVIAVFLACLVACLPWVYPLGLWLRRRGAWRLGSKVSKLGSFWLPGVLYGSLLLSAWEGIGWLARTARGAPWLVKALQGLPGVFSFASALVGLLFFGYRIGEKPQVRRLRLELSRGNGPAVGVRLVVASDLHAGGLVSPKQLQRIVEAIQELAPDIVLLPGDLLDAPPRRLEEEGFGEVFRKLQARWGVFACPGNHEFFVGIDGAVQFLARCGIRVLREEATLLDAGLVLVGREDFAGERFPGGKSRQPLGEILAGLDPAFPVIVMDHRPLALEEAVQCGVDLVVCGHTHNGQFWPFNWIVRRMFPVAYGYRKVGDTHLYVTSGAGSWGPPVRLGSPPEIVIMELVPESIRETQPASKGYEEDPGLLPL
ncbi:metallophosphoesterase [Candidatus Methylacidithermus pantelleriae]|uniref:Calcineurin-like phosphohydrolase n=1 Tax=Candidatus Methylacidithermus pantelleriae TaxID=2744239 RepID=A0A8J2FPC2_9BACT|nr:metallophosphoesterase [Candidatus Methylacidithermus pantelleriae]CAF0696395.1 Calcineurin-like phosphohydrolase [Candidatus Methylacidithermus pantelleriae]